ncbi:hypothetical protein BO221_08155 [Archangium sp. Cb G35]|uniref:hypothetical protein n=1 Tax=Archangium sp. Cb G35 TaxID=1920190 RepID=UPI00093567E3|nr:hypothetical protein [Archangium sp. Cb G35]OJT25814.1 hypothetical protein BO221_08155 [Archangium sp. Cb G35]
MRAHSGRSAVQGALVLVLALVLPIAASAENEGAIRGHIIAINSQYEDLEYERALGQVKLARQLPRSTDDEVTLSLYEGIILCEMGKQDLGASLFRAALLLRSGAKLPVQVAPKVDALFESMRTQVKQETAFILPPSGTEKPSTTAEQERLDPSASASTGLAVEKREETKGAPMPSEPGSAEAEQKKAEPVADQPVKLSDCGPKPARVASRSVKERQVWLLASMQHELCLRGEFHGLVSEKWMGLKTRIEGATTSQERMRIILEIDQFAREFIYGNPQRKAELLEARRLETERLEAEQLKVKQLEAERLETKRLEAEQLKVEQPEAELSSEWLMQQLLRLQGKLLQGDFPSKRVPLRELDKIGQQIRAAHTTESLQEAAHALDAWQQRHLTQ